MNIHEVLHCINSIDGWLSSHEGYFLYQQATETKGNIVEIGSWKGKSTICLASGLQKGKVFAVDPHKGKFTGGKKASTFQEFTKNLRSVGVLRKVKPIIATSEDASKKWKKSVSFLFIDGLHDYQHTYQDFTLWSTLLKNRGVIAFHDAFCGHDGPERVILEEILTRNTWSDVGVVGSIIFAKKEKAKTIAQKLNMVRHRILIPLAIKINRSAIQSKLKFFIIHRVIKALLLNRITLRLATYEKI